MRQVIIKLIALSLIALTACTPPTKEELHQVWTERCKGYGFKPRTPDFANCLMQQEMAREARQQQNMDAWANEVFKPRQQQYCSSHVGPMGNVRTTCF